MDVIDDVLDGLKLQSSVFSRMELSGQWGLSKEPLKGAPFHVILSGEAWLRLPGQPNATRLAKGDVAILPNGDAHDLMATPKAQLTPFKTVLATHGMQTWLPGDRVRPVTFMFGSGTGETTHLISGVFGFGDRRENPLLAALPRLFHLRSGDADAACSGAWLAGTVTLLEAEVGSGHAGSGAVAARLADILFIQALRMHLTAAAAQEPGWLRGVVDPQIGRALSVIHAQRDQPWSVATLAAAVGMSRSRFAERFQEVVGRTPLDYLTRWRMYEAAGQLAEGKVGLRVLAEKAGYRSEIAFSKAFKRWAGQSPADFKRSAHAS